MNYKLSMFTLAQIRKLSSSHVFKQQNNHYESLGIGKNATQADVKAAYYNLSKIYHPDRNHGTTLEQREQHSQKFRDISAAYEVLGNVKTRKMYDKGLLGGNIFGPQVRESTPDDPLSKFYKSREFRAKPPPPSGGRQPIYDFDEWSRQHYGASVKRDQELKQRRSFYASQMKAKKENLNEEFTSLLAFVIIISCLVLKHFTTGIGYDTPKKGKYYSENNENLKND